MVDGVSTQRFQAGRPLFDVWSFDVLCVKERGLCVLLCRRWPCVVVTLLTSRRPSFMLGPVSFVVVDKLAELWFVDDDDRKTLDAPKPEAPWQLGDVSTEYRRDEDRHREVGPARIEAILRRGCIVIARLSLTL